MSIRSKCKYSEDKSKLEFNPLNNNLFFLYCFLSHHFLSSRLPRLTFQQSWDVSQLLLEMHFLFFVVKSLG